MDPMQEHYRLSDDEYEKLTDTVSTTQMIKAVHHFDVNGDGEPIGKHKLMHFIDRHGDFNEGNTHLHKIAKAVFKSLPSNDQAEVVRYLISLEDEE